MWSDKILDTVSWKLPTSRAERAHLEVVDGQQAFNVWSDQYYT